MSKLTYTVIPFGLLKLEDRPTKAKKVSKGLLEQIEDSNVQQYEGLTLERLEEVVNSVFSEREERVTATNIVERMIPYQQQYDLIRQRVDQLVGETRSDLHQQFEQGFRDQLITGESRYIIGMDPINTTEGEILNVTSTTTSPSGEVFRITSTGETITNRQRQQQALLTQLNTGQISAITYLDLISNL